MADPKMTPKTAVLPKESNRLTRPVAAQGPRAFSRRPPSPNLSAVIKDLPMARELMSTEKEIKDADHNDVYSLATVMRACRKWGAFHEASSKEEDEFALPYFRRFVRAMKSYISESPQERAIPAIRELAELIQIDLPSVSYVFTELCSDPREDVRDISFRALEKNSYNFLKAMDLYSRKSNTMLDQIGTILKIYAEGSYRSPETMMVDDVNGDSWHPHPPNEEIAASISTFLFFQKEGLLRTTEGVGFLPYALSWASDHYDADKIDFMIDRLSGLPREFSKEILLKTVIFANSEPIRECALDLLMDMGVYSISGPEEIGGLEDVPFVNRMLMQKFTETYGRFADNIVMPPTSLPQ